MENLLLQAVGFKKEAIESTFGANMQYGAMRGVRDTGELCDLYAPAGIVE
jgi:hypothetical protein